MSSSLASVRRLNWPHDQQSIFRFGPSESPFAYWPEPALSAQLAFGGPGFVIENEEGVKGFASFLRNPQAFELIVIVIAPESQGQGFGRQLLEESIKELWNEALIEIWLEVHEKNTAAQNLYLSLGFKQVGVRPRYYRDGASARTMSLPVPRG